MLPWYHHTVADNNFNSILGNYAIEVPKKSRIFMVHNRTGRQKHRHKIKINLKNIA